MTSGATPTSPASSPMTLARANPPAGDARRGTAQARAGSPATLGQVPPPPPIRGTASPAAASGRIVPTPASDGGAAAFRAASRNERHPAPGTSGGATAGSATGCAPAGSVAAGSSASAAGGGTRAGAASGSTPSGSTADGRTPSRGNRCDAEGEGGQRVRRRFTGPNELQHQLSYHGDNVDASLLERQSLAGLRLGVAREMVGLLKGPMDAARKAAVQAERDVNAFERAVEAVISVGVTEDPPAPRTPRRSHTPSTAGRSNRMRS